VRSTLVYVQSY